MHKMEKTMIFSILFSIYLVGFPLGRAAYGGEITTSRWSGENRYETAAAVSKAMWNNSFYAIVAAGENFPDALSAATLGKAYNAPILLTGQETLNSNTRLRLKQLGVHFVFIVGGPGAVGEGVEREIRSMGIEVKRLAGLDRYDTSAKIAEQLGNVTEVALVTGTDFPDALTISPIAAAKGMPILLVPKDTLTNALRSYAQSHSLSKITVMGNVESISEDTVKLFANTTAEARGEENSYPQIERITGKDQYIRNANAVKKFFNIATGTEEYTYEKVYIATGDNFPDALTGAVIAAKDNAPILLTQEKDTNITKELIRAGNVKELQILGGYGVVSNNLVTELLKAGYYDSNEEIQFPDAGLEQAIRRELGKYDGAITKGELEEITTLSASFKDITDLSGLENLTHLKELDLQYNSITELYPLRNLKELKKLTLDHNFIEDLSALGNMEALEELSGYQNKMKNISPLKRLNNLNSLDLRGNTIESIEPLENLSTLKTLYLQDNPVTDFSVVKNYYESLEHKDFDLNTVSQDPLSGYSVSLEQISKEDKAAIKNFMEKYKQGSYGMYKILYHSFQNMTYTTEIQALLEDKKEAIDEIASLNNLNDIDALKERLGQINHEIGRVQKEYEMNEKVAALEGEISSTVMEKERIAKRNKINAIYSQYMLEYYGEELTLCTKEIGEKESLLQSLDSSTKNKSAGEVDKIHARMSDLLKTVQRLKVQSNFLQERYTLYSSKSSFYNVLTVIYE